MALLVRVSHDLFEVLRMDRIQDVEEVLSRWTFAGRKPVGEVLHHRRVLFELRPDALDAELFEVRDRNLVDFRLQE